MGAFTGNNNVRGALGAHCSIFRWNGTAFEEFQILEISGGYDAEAFQVHGDEAVVLVVVTEDSTSVYSAPSARLRSRAELKGHVDAKVLPGDAAGFSLLQRLDVPQGRDAKHFRADGADYVALAVFRDDMSHKVDSR